MPDVAEQPAKPLRTWRPMAVWTAGILLALGLVWFVASIWNAKVGTIERTVAELADEKAVLSDTDGASGTSPFIDNIDSIPSMKRLEAMGPKAVPVLINHLDDDRPTGLRGPGWGTRRVGDLCLQLLWRIVQIKDTPGAGHDLWFDTKDSPKKMAQAKRAWQWEYYKPDSLLRKKNLLENECCPWF